MLEKPDLREDAIAACLQDAYGLCTVQVVFLPLGADLNTAVYRAVTADGAPYFVKLRRGDFAEIAVALPKYLSDLGIRQIIAPLATRAGRLWTDLGPFKVILYPFIEGHNGYEANLTDRHWVAFGAALKRIHTAAVPPTLTNSIPQETYSPRWRDIVRRFLARVEEELFADPVAAKLAAFLTLNRTEVLDLVDRTERLAQALQTRPPPCVVCHSDLHAGNILIAADGALYIVDWDSPILAPVERDLMFAGGGQFGAARTPDQEETLFYRGYGPTAIDPTALAYYRYERIIEDIAVFCEQLFLSDDGGEDREQALRYLVSNFLPDGTIAIARQGERKEAKKMTDARVGALLARLERGQRRTHETLDALTADQWETPVYPGDPRWTVRGVLAHCVSAEERLLELAQDVAAGGAGAPEGFDFDAFNAGEQERLADQPSQQLLAALDAVRRRTLAWVATLNGQQLDQVGRHPALGQINVEAMITAIYGHQLLHMRDLPSATRYREPA